MYETGADFTNSFRKLSELKLSGVEKIEDDITAYLLLFLSECSSIDDYKMSNRPRMPKETLDKFLKAMESTPEILAYFGLSESFVRNQSRLIQKYEKIKDFSAEDKHKSDTELWSKWLRKYLNRLYAELGESAIFEAKNKERVSMMNMANPRFILRNHLAQAAIEAAERGDFNEARMLLVLLENPFSEKPLDEILHEFDKNVVQRKKETKFYEKPPVLLQCVKLTCSS